MSKKLMGIALMVQMLVLALTGCKLQSVSDIQTTSANGITMQHSIYFDDMVEIDDGNIHGFKWSSKNLVKSEPHYDYGWALLIDKEITNTDDLQEVLRTYTNANMTHRWFTERDSLAGQTTTLQGYYESIVPGIQGFAEADAISDAYKMSIYAVADNGSTRVVILAINQNITQLDKDEITLMRSTICKSEDFQQVIESETPLDEALKNSVDDTKNFVLGNKQ